MLDRRKPLRFTSGMAVGCVVLFLLPFAAAGTLCAVRAYQLASAGVWPDALFLGIGALVFGGVGFGGLAGIRVAHRRLRGTEALQAAHPEEPWLWRRDWAAGRIEDSTRETVLGAWIFAALWNLISLPGGYIGLRAARYEGKPAALVALLFPLVGLWLLARALHATLRKEKYGVSLLELSTVPAAVGQSLAGTVRAVLPSPPPDGFQVTLTCLRRVITRSGRSSSTSERVLWQDSQRISGEQIRDYSGMTTRIPVRFQLPPEVEPSATENPNDRVIWQLQITATVPGVDYDASFEVPVFRTTGSAQLPSPAEPGVASPIPYNRPADSPITVTSNRRGTEIFFPPARNPGPAIGMTVFTLIWGGAIALQLFFHAPLFFPIVSGLFGVLFAFFALELWLRVSRVTVDAHGLSLARGYLVPGRERTLLAGDIADVVAAIGMQAGKTVYYDVVIRRKDGRNFTAGGSVRDKREAEWLAATLKRSLGI